MVRRLCREQGGVIRTAQAVRAGVHPRSLYGLRDSGFLERLERGLYRLADLPELGQLDLVTAALKVPAGVVCLLSALAFHELTTQIPHEVSIALPRHTERPRLRFPPIRVFWFAAKAMEAGVETHTLDGVPVRIFDAEKTLADCFKYRNKIGLDTAVEALRLYRERKRLSVDALMRYAAIDRVKNVMRPYLEAVL
ncbi:MAG: type IV toxin-antitoxin system AbiEi family antitoxin domain-containing protein [Phycisphaerae bacterium]|nr:type IV toxin-antitoxin system AbiEi family antitoxin domain-containing protein [Phycisphaerae bacterium]